MSAPGDFPASHLDREEVFVECCRMVAQERHLAEVGGGVLSGQQCLNVGPTVAQVLILCTAGSVGISAALGVLVSMHQVSEVVGGGMLLRAAVGFCWHARWCSSGQRSTCSSRVKDGAWISWFSVLRRTGEHSVGGSATVCESACEACILGSAASMGSRPLTIVPTQASCTTCHMCQPTSSSAQSTGAQYRLCES
jgi:hypothetical protein